MLSVCETALGGVGVYQNHLSELSGLGCSPYFLVPDGEMDLVESLPNLRTFKREKRGAGATVRLVQATRRAIAELDPDICYFHSTFALAPLAALRRANRHRTFVYCPHSWAVTNYDMASAKGRVVRAVEGRLAGLADRVVCVSQHERDLAVELGYRGEFTVIENAVPAPEAGARSDLFSDEPDRLHLLFCGRLDRQKGFDVLAAALDACGRADIHVHVVGGAVRGDTSAVRMPGNVTLHGWVKPDQIDDWYRSADALIVPSRWEGLPLVVPEALRNGTPVLVSRRSGMETLVDPGRSGAHFELAVEPLAQMLRTLDKNTLRAMRPAARHAWEQRFTLNRMLGQLDDLFRSLVRA